MAARISPLSLNLVPLGLVAILTSSPALSFAQAPEVSAHASPTVSQSLDSTISLSWADVVRLVDAHPRLQAEQHHLNAELAAIQMAETIPNPNLSASTAYAEARDGSAAALEWGLALSIPLSWLSQRRANVRAAEANSRVASAEAAALRRDVLQSLSDLFWDLVYQQERAATLSELSTQTNQLASVVAKRVTTGESRPIEALRLEVEAEKLIGALAVTESNLSARRRQLGLWLGIAPQRTVTAKADLTRLAEPLALDRARAQVRTGHPAVAAAAARIQELSERVSAERSARVPAISVEAFTDQELDRRAYGVGITVDLPVFNWNSAGIRRAEADFAEARRSLDAERLQVEGAVIDAQAACLAAIRLEQHYSKRVVPRAISVARTIERTYELGEVALLEVIDARRTLLDTRSEHIAALVKAHIDCSRFSALVGEETP